MTSVREIRAKKQIIEQYSLSFMKKAYPGGEGKGHLHRLSLHMLE